jgi:hypothetical protein
LPQIRREDFKKEYLLAIVATVVSIIVSAFGYLDWRWVVILTIAYFLSAFLVRKGEKAHWWTKKRKVNTFCFVLFLVWTVAWINVPDHSIGQIAFPWGQQDINYHLVQKIGNSPTISYHVTLDFNTVGTFSVGNTIWFSVKVFDSNTTIFNLEKPNYPHYCCYAFTSPFGLTNHNDVILRFSDNQNSTYTASGTGEFAQSGPVWFYLYPPAHTGNGYNGTLTSNELKSIHSNSTAMLNTAILNISPDSDTISVRTNDFVAKVAIVLAGFNFLLLPSVFEGIFIRQHGDE